MIYTDDLKIIMENNRGTHAPAEKKRETEAMLWQAAKRRLARALTHRETLPSSGATKAPNA
jgi:hypothetical protein